MSDIIQLDALPARMRMLAADMQAVGTSVSHYGGAGPFGEWGALLTEQTAPMCLALAHVLEAMQGGHA